MKRWLPIIAIVAVVGLGWAALSSDRFAQWQADQEKKGLPSAETIDTIVNSITEPLDNSNSSANANTNAPVEIPDEKNLAVPFTSQAPHANWDEDHNEFCEEASVLMTGRYFSGRSIPNADDAEKGLQQIKAWEVENLGFYFDTTAAETAKIIEGVYDLNVEQKISPTIDDIKQALAEGKIVLVPAAGRELGNPNYTPPGPLYHFLLIRGYTKDGKFITNDSGTRRGEEYVYKQEVVMNAMHDWIPGNDRKVSRNGTVALGQKIVLIVSKKTTTE